MKMRMLLVDDDAATLEAEEKYFSETDEYIVTGKASNGAEAIKLFTKLEPDVMIMDMIMPIVDGVSVLNTIGKSDCITVAVGETDGESYAGAALAAGADYYMLKPCSPEEIDKHIKLLKAARKAAITPRNSRIEVGELDKRISDVFMMVGIPAHIRGFRFLREAVKLAVSHPEIINSITKKLYPEVAELFETSPSKVERAIRHAIEVAWNKGRIENVNSVFGVRIYTDNERPTNGEFIALIADKMLLESV